jgi:hypothetical protein
MCLVAWGLKLKSRNAILDWILKSKKKVHNNKDKDALLLEAITPKLLTELARVHGTIKEESAGFKSAEVTNEMIGQRLMFVFQMELLPTSSSDIMNTKSKRDRVCQETVEPWIVYAGWAFIASLNIGMIFYIFLFSITQSASNQAAWLKSFALWLGKLLIIMKLLLSRLL